MLDVVWDEFRETWVTRTSNLRWVGDEIIARDLPEKEAKELAKESNKAGIKP